MVATPLWIGGGNNNANNPKDWSPTGVPPSGSTVYMEIDKTINIKTGELFGDTLETNVILPSQPPTGGNATDTVNLSGYVGLTIHSGERTNGPGYDQAGTLDVNLAAHATWLGSIRGLLTSMIFIDGASNSVFLNQASYVDRTSATINVPVAGTGVFNSGVDAEYIFNNSVGAGQIVESFAAVLNDPKQFAGSIIFYQQILINNLSGNVSSYSFANDVLSLYAGKKIVDTLKISGSFDVEKTGTHSVGLYASGYDPYPVLPVHT